jgi:tetratricopeptide (TPR) repeat protein
MDRKPHVRSLLHGLVSGALLSCLRAPLGIDWTQVPAVEGRTAGLVRGAALLMLTMSLVPGARAFRGGLAWTWFLGLVLGFERHAFHAPLWMEPASRTALAGWLIAGWFLLRVLAGSTGERGEPGSRRETTGLILIGLGSTLGLEALARELRQLTPFPGAEDVSATVAVLLVAAGALSFGPLLRRPGAGPLRTAVGAALAGASTLAGLVFLSRLSPEGLHGYLRRFDALTSGLRTLDARLGDPLGLADVPALGSGSVGTLWVTALLTAAALVVPLLVLGATLGGARGTERVRSLLVGSALALVVEPYLIRALAQPVEGQALHLTPWAWNWTMVGSAVAALGVLLAAWPARSERGGRLAPLLAASAVAGLPWTQAHLVVWSFSPWSIAPIQPDRVQPTTAGLVTVERARDGTPIVTLDRRRVSPVWEEEPTDAQRLQQSFELLPAADRAGRVRTLFVGAMTPARAHALSQLGDLELDRTAPWFEACEAVEELLFAGHPPPPGNLVEPSRARARLASGEYDWVVVPPVSGAILVWRSEAREPWGSAEAPRLHGLDLESGLGVAWVMADSPIAAALPEGRVLPWMHHLEDLALGWVVGAANPAEGGPLLLPTGAPGEAPGKAEVLRWLPQQRKQPLEAAVGRRLWNAARMQEGDPRGAAIGEGLGRHLEAQAISSPFETRAQQVEVDEGALRAFQQAVAASPVLDPFQRELWEGVAWLTREKRLPEEALVYLEPIADRFQPWPDLDRAVAEAYLEVLEPEEALRVFERIAESVLDIELLVRMGEVASDLGDLERAAGYWDRALALQPGHPGVLRAYGLARLRAGDEGGRDLLERYLESVPDDEVVRAALDR